jgi:hypothetical protein
VIGRRNAVHLPHLQGGLVVTAPVGVRVDVLDASGALVESHPLRDGAGTADLAAPDASVTARIVDAAGGVVAETSIEIVG